MIISSVLAFLSFKVPVSYVDENVKQSVSYLSVEPKRKIWRYRVGKILNHDGDQINGCG